MANVSKSSLPRKAPNQTRNGRMKLGPLSIAKLQDLSEKATRLKDKNKFQNRIKVLVKRGK